MSLIKMIAFNGMTPRTDPRLLEDNMAQSTVNAKLQHGTLRPFMTPGQIATLSKSGTIKSIYRFGQDVVGDANYWFHWTTDVNVVRGPIAGDAYERTYWTGDGAPKMTTNTIALTGGTAYPINSYALGIPSPENAPVATVSGTGDGVAETRVYAYTYLSNLGEEGPPSPISNGVDVKVGQTVLLSGMSTAPTGNYNIVGKRIYRSVAGSAGSDYLFVAEIDIANTTFTDTILAAALGEVCPSKTWLAPPADLQGLTVMANGILAGFTGKDIYFCEPFMPHAWPVSYVLTVDYPIVGIGAFGASLFVGTSGNPYIINGVDPMSMSMTKAEFQQACVSKRSIVEMGGGVMYASPDGVVMVDGSGINLVTRSMMAKDDWQAYKPSSMVCSQLDGRYYAFYDTGSKHGCAVLDLTGDGAALWGSDEFCTATYNDVRTDSMYMAQSSNVKKWDAGSTKLTYTWRSKIFVLPKPTNMMVGQVFATAYPITMKIYSGGVLKHTQTVANDNPFKLPSGFKGKEWEVEVSGTNDVNIIYLATSVEELKQA